MLCGTPQKYWDKSVVCIESIRGPGKCIGSFKIQPLILQGPSMIVDSAVLQTRSNISRPQVGYFPKYGGHFAVLTPQGPGLPLFRMVLLIYLAR